jgi:hypothetical protein
MLRGLARTLKLGKEKFYVGVDLQGMHNPTLLIPSKFI